MGSDEEHREWDAREKLRYRLKDAAKEVLGKNYGVEMRDCDDFFYKLLCDDAVIEALRREEKEELSALIKQKRKTYSNATEKSKVRFHFS